MNIDSTPIEGIDTKQYKEILGLNGYMTVLALAMGYRDENDFNQISKSPNQRLEESKVIQEIK